MAWMSSYGTQKINFKIFNIKFCLHILSVNFDFLPAVFINFTYKLYSNMKLVSLSHKRLLWISFLDNVRKVNDINFNFYISKHMIHIYTNTEKPTFSRLKK